MKEDRGNKRKTRLKFVREVKGKLIEQGHEVEGPGYLTMFVPENPLQYKLGINKKTRAVQVHRDYFGVADLISLKEGKVYFHQVSIIEEKSRKTDLFLEKGIKGFVWGRTRDGGKIHYRIFRVELGEVQEIGINNLE